MVKKQASDGSLNIPQKGILNRFSAINLILHLLSSGRANKFYYVDFRAPGNLEYFRYVRQLIARCSITPMISKFDALKCTHKPGNRGLDFYDKDWSQTQVNFTKDRLGVAYMGRGRERF